MNCTVFTYILGSWSESWVIHLQNLPVFYRYIMFLGWRIFHEWLSPSVRQLTLLRRRVQIICYCFLLFLFVSFTLLWTVTIHSMPIFPAYLSIKILVQYQFDANIITMIVGKVMIRKEFWLQNIKLWQSELHVLPTYYRTGLGRKWTVAPTILFL